MTQDNKADDRRNNGPLTEEQEAYFILKTAVDFAP